MEAKVFMTGATGFAGGAMLHTLSLLLDTKYITALVRSPAQAETLHQVYPGLKTALGTLDSRELLVAEAFQADIVLHASNADHERGTFSLLDGLKSRPSKDKGVFIHVSGASSLINLHDLRPGQPGRVYSDIDDADEIFDLPHSRVHVAIERRLMMEGEAAGVKVVVLAPPIIFPSGTGIGRQDSFSNLYARAILRRGYPFVIGQGQNAICWISSDDLAEAVCFIIQEALKGDESRLGHGKDGYYFCEAAELEVMEQSRTIAKVLARYGAIQTADLVSITPQDALELDPMAVVLWGSGMRTRADKLRALGWRPKTEDWVPFVKELAKVEGQGYVSPKSRRHSIARR